MRATLFFLILSRLSHAFLSRPSGGWHFKHASNLNERSDSSNSNFRGNRRGFNHHQRPTFFSIRRSGSMGQCCLQAEAGEGAGGDPVRLIIAGAPASGKGTQCEIIKDKYGVVHLSTGDMLRAAVKDGTPVGKEAKGYMDSGKLVPDEVIIGVVKDRLAQDDCVAQGWLLDGFPRTLAQAKAMEDAGIKADCFIFLNVPDEVLVERVVGRRTDPDTGKIYHLKFSPPPADDQALLDRLVHRSDDTEEKVKVRLEQFHANIDAVKGSFTDIMVTVDGNQSPSVVSEEVGKAIDSKLEVSS